MQPCSKLSTTSLVPRLSAHKLHDQNLCISEWGGEGGGGAWERGYCTTSFTWMQVIIKTGNKANICLQPTLDGTHSQARYHAGIGGMGMVT